MMANGNDRIEIGLSTTIEQIVEAHPEVLEILEEFGIRLDPWTLIALKSTVQELAEYSAIRRPDELRSAIAARLREKTAGDETAARR